MSKTMCWLVGVIGLVTSGMFSGVGCKTNIEQIISLKVFIKILDDKGVELTPTTRPEDGAQVLRVPVGTLLRFVAIGESGNPFAVGTFFDWLVSTTEQTRSTEAGLVLTFDRVGMYEVRLTGVDVQYPTYLYLVSEKRGYVIIEVGPTGTSPPPPAGTPLPPSFSGNPLLNGTTGDTVEIDQGGSVTVDLSGIIRNGRPPFDILILSGGVVIQQANGLSVSGLVITFTPGGAGDYVIRVVDADQRMVEITIHIRFRGQPPPPPPPPPAPTVDLKINNNDGPVEVFAPATIELAWGSSDAVSLTASGGWSGEKAANGTEIISGLAIGEYHYKLRVVGASGDVDEDEVMVRVRNVPPPPPTRFRLTVVTTGGGVVTLDPSGGEYNAGTVVMLTASPEADYRFVSWGGHLSGDTNPTTITMNSDKAVAASFERPPSPLMEIVSIEVSPPADGIVHRTGERTTFTIRTNKDGEIGFLLQTMTWPGDVWATNQVATITYHWPGRVDPRDPVDGRSFFWPEDRNFAPWKHEVFVRVLDPGEVP